MTGVADGQVHKIVRVVGTSPTSWEAAAHVAVAEAGRTIKELRTATVVDADLVVDHDHTIRYRLKLEVCFQLDRSRVTPDGHRVTVRRYLIIANHTLASPDLRALIDQHDAAGPAEFHILVPEATTPAPYLTDPMGLAVALPYSEHEWKLVLEDAEARLDAFLYDLRHLGNRVTGEVGLGDPLLAAHRVMEYASFDEIIISTLPPGLSRWLGLDLPSRLHRAFRIPVTPLIQPPGAGHGLGQPLGTHQ